MNTIHKELKINMKTLEAYGAYVDFIGLDDGRTIRLVLKVNDEERPVEYNTGVIGSIT